MTESPKRTRSFHHFGLRSLDPQPVENFDPTTRVWVTNPTTHPQRIEYLRYEPDSYLSDEFKNTPHVAWVVDTLELLIEGKEIAIPRFDVGELPFASVVFVYEEGMISEYMAFKPDTVWFDAKKSRRFQFEQS